MSSQTEKMSRSKSDEWVGGKRIRLRVRETDVARRSEAMTSAIFRGVGGRTEASTVRSSNLELITSYHYIFKVVLNGDAGVGKSQLLARYSRDVFLASTLPTIGGDICVKEVVIEDSNIAVQIWDTAGQERFRAVVMSQYREAVGGLVVYDITNRRSFDNVAMWLRELRSEAAPNIIIVLIGNKSDLENQREVPTKEAQEFAKREKILFFEASAKDSTNVESAFMKLYTEIISHSPKRNAFHLPDRNVILGQRPIRPQSSCCCLR